MANDIVKAVSSEDAIRVLGNSLYPGAKRESIELVLAYCRFNGLDPMLKVVHIVPTNVKVGEGKWEKRDVLMPGIADYRIKAARSGEYGGKSEPEFGPDVTQELDGVTVTYPQWCRITVQRIVAGQARAFVAKEFWTENYATRKHDSQAPNAMWLKRAYGQLAKVAEAQALRMAFPEFSGGAPTAEEMEGKTLNESFQGQTIDATAEPAAPAADAPKRATVSERLDSLEAEFNAAQTGNAVDAIIARDDVQRLLDYVKDSAKARLDAMVKSALDRTAAPAEAQKDDVPY